MLFALVVATLFVAAAQHFTESVPAQRHPRTHTASKTAGAPYGALFQVPPIEKAPESVTTRKPVYGTVKEVGGVHRGPCNMPIIAANADVDPKILVPIPEHAKKSAKIRAIEPPKCK